MIFHDNLSSENVLEERLEISFDHVACEKRELDLLVGYNWRGIARSLTREVFSKIMQQRMTAALEKNSGKEQAGFSKGKSFSDHIVILRQDAVP